MSIYDNQYHKYRDAIGKKKENIEGCGDDSAINRRSKYSIYTARQGMRACNNNNMRNPTIKEM